MRRGAQAGDASADSPIKSRRDLEFSHFSRRYKSKLSDSEAFYVRFNTDASLAAVSFFDGSLQIISTMLGDRLYQIKDDTMNMPITSLTWKPTRDESQDSQKLLGACLDGGVLRWTSSMSNSVEHVMLDESNRFHAIDYASDGRRFCVAGTQPWIDVVDEERMVRVQRLGDRIDAAHTNKIFCCRFNHNAPNMIYSGGWDREVRLWDVRAAKMSHSVGGKTSIAGDSVDMSSCCNYLATGGGTLGEGVQIWDMRNLRTSMCSFVWQTAPSGDIVNPVVNSLRFLPRTPIVMAGCSDEAGQSAKCFSLQTGDVVEEFHRVGKNCFSLDVSRDGNLAMIGDSTGALHFENINYTF